MFLTWRTDKGLNVAHAAGTGEEMVFSVCVSGSDTGAAERVSARR